MIKNSKVRFSTVLPLTPLFLMMGCNQYTTFSNALSSPLKIAQPSTPTAPPTVTPTGTSQAPALVNHIASTTGTTSAISGTGANFIAICAGGQPTDSAGNTYTNAYEYDFSGEISNGLWVAFRPSVSGSMTFSTTASPSSIAVMLFNGVASGPDKTAGATNLNPLLVPSVTPTKANELVIGCYGQAATSFVSVHPLTILDQPFVGYGGWASAYQIQTAATAVSPSWTVSGGGSGGFPNTALSATFYSDEAPAPLAITNTNLPEGFVSTAYGSTTSLYSNQLAATGGVPPYTYSCPAACALPGTLSVSSGGLLTGTPAASLSATNITLKVSDSASNTATVTLPLTIVSTVFSGTEGTCTGSALNGTQTTAYAGCTLSTSGGTSPYTYTVSTNSNYPLLPYGMLLNSSTGAITSSYIGGEGYFNPLINIQDSLGAQANINLIFEIAGNNATSALPIVGSIFNTNISSLPVDTSPAAPVQSGVASTALRLGFGNVTGGGIPFLVVPYNQGLVSVTTSLYQSYFTEGPWPWYAPIEESWNCPDYDCDHHSLIIQNAGGGNPARLWEMWEGEFAGTPGTNGAWTDFSNFYLPNLGTSGTGAYEMPPQSNGSSDAAGLPVTPLLVNYDEVAAGAVLHPIRFTLEQPLHNYVWPATVGSNGYGSCSGGYEDGNNMLEQASPPSSCSDTMPFGEIYRLKASVSNPSCASTSPQSAVIITALRNYGIIVSDIGLNGDIVGTPDSRWNDSDLSCLTSLTLGDFEPVNVSGVAVNVLTSYQTAP